MDFEWDEDKRQRNLAKHDVDFLRARLVFDGRPSVTSRSSYQFEVRWLTTAIVDDRFYIVISTDRAGTIRIISARSARDAEKRTYREIHG